jgi:predicted MFS family arabinose efflux permease
MSIISRTFIVIQQAINSATYVRHTLITAMFCGIVIPPVLYIAQGIAKRPALIGYTVAFVNMIYFIGIFAGMPIVMGIATSIGWRAWFLYILADYILADKKRYTKQSNKPSKNG